MAWTSPVTVVAGQTVTAAMWNAVRDNLLASEMAKAAISGQVIVGTGAHAVNARSVTYNSVPTAQTTASATYVDLATPGPAVTMTTGTSALVCLTATLANNTAGGYADVSYQVSGATTYSAPWAVLSFRAAGTDQVRYSGFDFVWTLNPGSNGFKMIYRAGGAGTATFIDREILVWPIG